MSDVSQPRALYDIIRKEEKTERNNDLGRGWKYKARDVGWQKGKVNAEHINGDTEVDRQNKKFR